MAEGWWERYPAEFEREKKALDDAGCRWEIDEGAMAQGQLRINVWHEHAGRTLELTAIYPDTYPYFPPAVEYRSALLERHHNPVGRNLCLLAREGEDWQPGVDTLAGLLATQLPTIFEIEGASLVPDEVAQKEDHVGEPASSFVGYAFASCVVVPDDTPAIEFDYGLLHLARRSVGANTGSAPFQAWITSISDRNNQPIIRSGGQPAFADQSVKGFWLRLREKPPLDALASVANYIVEKALALPAIKNGIERGHRGEEFVVGVVYADEVSWRQSADDWIFFRIKITQKKQRSRGATFDCEPIRADWGGPKERMRRAPYLGGLSSKSALLVGLGSLGSPLALQLARAGIAELRLVDYDHLQSGNMMRWALGAEYVGLPKGPALARYITMQYPTVKAEAVIDRIGSTRAPTANAPTDFTLITERIGATDIVIDASANYRVSHFLADMARAAGKPYLWLTTTPGCAGGVVGRIRPGVTKGCWHCAQHGMRTGVIRKPADAGTDDIQPGGCSQPTFVGAGVDSDEVALQAARLAIATLTTADSNAYPDFDWDVAVLDLQRDGRSIAPDWTPYPLDRHSECRICAGTK